jgi:hypothetical protein
VLLKHQKGPALVIGRELYACNNEAIKQKHKHKTQNYKSNTTGGTKNEKGYEV